MPLSPAGASACRAALGGLQWLAIQSRLQLCARCNLLLAEVVADSALDTAKEIQAMNAEVREELWRACGEMRASSPCEIKLAAAAPKAIQPVD